MPRTQANSAFKWTHTPTHAHTYNALIHQHFVWLAMRAAQCDHQNVRRLSKLTCTKNHNANFPHNLHVRTGGCLLLMHSVHASNPPKMQLDWLPFRQMPHSKFLLEDYVYAYTCWDTHTATNAHGTWRISARVCGFRCDLISLRLCSQHKLLINGGISVPFEWFVNVVSVRTGSSLQVISEVFELRALLLQLINNATFLKYPSTPRRLTYDWVTHHLHFQLYIWHNGLDSYRL